MSDYWWETISEACEDAGLSVSREQVDTLTCWVEGAYENYSLAHGDSHTRPRMVLESEHQFKVRVMEQETAARSAAWENKKKELRYQIADQQSTIDDLRRQLRAVGAAL